VAKRRRECHQRIEKGRRPKNGSRQCTETLLGSNTAHDIYILQGGIPETVMSGETSDISQFCEFAFYDWIMFRDQPVAFPDDNPVLGRYLRPAIDVCPALTAKILKANGEVV
jgi:hypothetical protein